MINQWWGWLVMLSRLGLGSSFLVPVRRRSSFVLNSVSREEYAFGSALAPVELGVNESLVGVARYARESGGTAPVRKWDNLVGLLRGSAPYIELHQNSIMVIHVSSNLDDDSFQDAMNDVATLHVLGVKIVLVASVRSQVEKRLLAAGEGQSFVRGKRVTGADELKAVQAEAGIVRSRIEAALARGLGSSGLIGRVGGRNRVGVDVVSSNGFFVARPIGVLDGIDLGATGAVRSVESAKVLRHLENREIVLLTPLGYSASGDTYNVLTEEIAAKAAPELRASKLIFLTDGHELIFKHTDNAPRVQSLRLDDAKRLIGHKSLLVAEQEDEGKHAAAQLINLCEWSVRALEHGVVRAHLVPPVQGALLQELYTRDGAGTLIASDIYEGIRTAKPEDLDHLLSLIAPLEQDGTLIQRPRDQLRTDIAAGCYYVIAREQLPIACAMLKRLDSEGKAAELGCLVVDSQYRSLAKGDALLSYLERVAIANNITHLFALSTRTMQWFVERGFEEVDFESLPADRRESYDTARMPKIYRKTLRSDRHVDLEECFWMTRSSYEGTLDSPASAFALSSSLSPSSVSGDTWLIDQQRAKHIPQQRKNGFHIAPAPVMPTPTNINSNGIKSPSAEDQKNDDTIAATGDDNIDGQQVPR